MNTKSDIGPCPCRYHEENLREQFEVKGGESYREEYERDFLAFLEGLVNDLERRLKRGKERLEVRPNDPSVTNVHNTNDETEEQRILLDLQLKEILAKIEAFGEEGRIREAQEMTIQADALKTELDQLKGTVDYENPLHKLEKKMEVCTVCGAFLVMNDAPKRMGAHFDGRQHSGWVKVRESVELLRQKWSSYQRSSGSGSGSGSRSSSNRHGSDRTRDYEHGNDRGYGRERDRSRDSGRERYDRDNRRYISDRRDIRGDSRELNYKDSSSGRRDSRDIRERDRERERERDYDYERRDSREPRDTSSYNSSSSRDLRSDYKRKSSIDESSATKRPTYDNYVPGAGLDYELGEIVEDGEIPESR